MINERFWHHINLHQLQHSVAGNGSKRMEGMMSDTDSTREFWILFDKTAHLGPCVADSLKKAEKMRATLDGRPSELVHVREVTASADANLEIVRHALDRINKWTIDPKDLEFDKDFGSAGHRQYIINRAKEGLEALARVAFPTEVPHVPSSPFVSLDDYDKCAKERDAYREALEDVKDCLEMNDDKDIVAIEAIERALSQYATTGVKP